MSSLFVLLLSFVLILIAITVWLWIQSRKNAGYHHFCLNQLNATQAMTWHWIIEKDSIEINHNWGKFLGFSILDLKPFSYCKLIKLVHEDDTSKVKRTVETVLHGESNDFELDFRIKTKDQDYKWVRLVGQVTKKDKLGQAQEMSGVLNDVNAAVQCELLLQKHAHRDGFLSDLPYLAKKHDRIKLIQKSLDMLEAVTHSKVGLVYFYNAEQGALALEVFSIADFTAQQHNDVPNIIRNLDFIEDAVSDKKPLIVNRPDRLAALTKSLEGELDLQRLIFVPVIEAGEVVMSYIIANAGQDYSEEDLHSVQLVAGQVWYLLQQQQLKQSLLFAEQKLEQQAYFDSLTNLPNQNLVMDRLQQAIERQKRSRKDLALLLIDLDGFTQINAQYGVQAGDALLQTIGQRYSAALRSIDTVGRIGCDEFVVLIESYANSKDIMYIAKRLQEDGSRPCQFDEQEICVTASIGVFFYHEPEQAMQPDSIIRKAEIALNQAKQRGSNTIAVYQPGME